MTLSNWRRPGSWAFSPVRRVSRLHDDLDNLFNFALARLNPALGLATQPGASRGFPVLDIHEDENQLVLKAELPGMKKEDIQISLHDGVLTLAGERKSEHTEETASVYRSERVLGQFQRSVTLPYQVDADKITATYTDGILTVSLPKSPEAKAKQIPISIQ